jgi:DNA-binding NtrC family response regulator
MLYDFRRNEERADFFVRLFSRSSVAHRAPGSRDARSHCTDAVGPKDVSAILQEQRRLRHEGATIPVIIITAFDDLRSLEQAERLGCVAYLRKPCEAETTLALLRRLAHDEPSSKS